MYKRPLPIDLDHFGLDPSEAERPHERVRRRSALPRPHKGEPYFGKIPMGWVERAAALPGRAWHLACALWFEAACAGGSPKVRLSAKTRGRFGLAARSTFYRAVRSLRQARLIHVPDRSGRTPLFTILPVA
jgi:hypothetical protein